MKLKKIFGLSVLTLCAIGMASCRGKKNPTTSTSTSVESTPAPSIKPTPSSSATTPAPSGSSTATPSSSTTSAAPSSSTTSTTPATTIPTTPATTIPTTAPTTPTEPEIVVPKGLYFSAAPLNPLYGGGSSTSEEDVHLDTIRAAQANVETVEGELKKGTGKVTTEGAIQVTSVRGSFEAAHIEYKPVASATNYKIEIKGGDYADYTALNTDAEKENKNIYTDIQASKVTTDIFGLKKGDYKLRISPIGTSGAVTECDITVEAYDRSGYAHFNCTTGVGAYKDDGTLKENAIVLYVTDTNKNTVTLSYGGKTVTGIGNILNTAGQKCGEAGHENDCKKVSSGKTYYGKGNENQGILKTLTENNIPLVIRFVGIVSESGLYESKSFDAASEGLIDGLTDYNVNDYGGSVGDNGHMARMKSGKDITIEGVGEGAILDGWGIHFMAESAYPTGGKSFEVRNMSFINTPEDALGMEGVQDGDTLTASVEHVWIHNNCFFKPTIANPAESDKSEGDGSCDFKRGQYYTLAYNYFEYCHKTNLVGSSDTSRQYNISVHHNYWYNCGSRITLTRQCNMHFYNNYNYDDITDKDAALSYITSLRANCYIYSENNYYEGCKNVFQTKNGYAKCFQNTYVNCFGTLYEAGCHEVTDREEAITNGCKYGSTDYSSFDTDPTLFYYDSTNKKSDCYMTSSEVARIECIQFAGSEYRTIANKASGKIDTTVSAKRVPTDAIVLTDGKFTAPIATQKNSSVVNHIYFDNVTGTSSSYTKFKGQGITFKVDTPVVASITYTGSYAGIYPGQIISASGKVMLSGDGNVVLTPGVYYVTSTTMDKESCVSSLSFEAYNEGEYYATLKTAYETAYAAIPETIDTSIETYNKIVKAINLYNQLKDSDKALVTDPTPKNDAFVAAYKKATEDAITAIGTVTKDSGTAIYSANSYYRILQALGATPSNLATLTQALNDYDAFAPKECMDKITAIGTVTLESKESIEAAMVAYDLLTDDQESKVTNATELTQAIKKYTFLYDVAVIDNIIYGTDVESKQSLEACLEAVNAVTSTYQAALQNQERLSYIKVALCNAYAKEIPATLASTDAPLVNKTYALYDSLTEEEKGKVEDAAKITAAKTTVDGMIQEYVVTLESTLSAASGTTANGFIYKVKATSPITLKKSDNNYIRSKELGSSEVTVKVTAKMIDTSNVQKLGLLVTYTDGTTETLEQALALGKKDSTVTFTITGKEVKTVELIGSTDAASKNVGITLFEITYKK